MMKWPFSPVKSQFSLNHSELNQVYESWARPLLFLSIGEEVEQGIH